LLKKIQIPPGINKESTQYAAAGSWYDANNVRFRRGKAEVVGGWSRDGTYDLQGFGRASFTSRDYSGNTYQFVGTDWKYYVIVGDLPYDITPVRDSGTLPGSTPFFAVNGNPEILVSDVSHGLSVNDWVVFTSVSSAGGGITAAQLTQSHGFQVSTVHSADVYSFYLVDWDTGNPIEPSFSASMGGTVDYSYKEPSGVSTQVSGQGWGAGEYGWDAPATPYALSTSTTPGEKAFEGTADGSGQLVARFLTSGVPTVDVDISVYFTELAGTVGDLDLPLLNNNWWNVDAIGTTGSYTEVTIIAPIDPNTTNEETLTASENEFYVAEADDGGSVFGASRGWGDSSSSTTETGTIRRVFIDNYGEDVMFSNSGGEIYYWDSSANTSSGIPVGTEAGVAKRLSDFSGSTDTPVVVESVLVSKKDGHCVALGCNDIGVTDGTSNSLLVRWSDQNNPFDWTPSPTNTSGGQVLRVGSKIIGGVSTKDEVVIFTDSAVYSMRFIGPPDIFSFNLITQGVEISSLMSAVNAASAVFFMGTDGFYRYTGSVSPIPCSVANYVFDDFNVSQREKCFGAVNSSFAEVMWFYPSADAFEPDRFVIFNYDNNSWSIGSFDMSEFSEGASSSNPYSRTSWRDAIIFSNPMSTYITDYAPSTSAENDAFVGASDYAIPMVEKSAVMIHENGTSAQGNSLSAHIESGELDISDGERFSFYSRVIPDLQLFNATDSSAQVTVSLDNRDFPGEASSEGSSTGVDFTVVSPNSSSTFTPTGNSTAIRGRARSVSMKISSDSSGFQWRLGDMRVDIRPDGRR
jgi:hypothetical protein